MAAKKIATKKTTTKKPTANKSVSNTDKTDKSVTDKPKRTKKVNTEKKESNMKAFTLFNRQGDVGLIKLSEPFVGNVKLVPNTNGQVILAYGEATGHMHAIRTGFESNVAELFEVIPEESKAEEEKNLQMGQHLLRVYQNTSLQHPEHGPINLTPGDWLVRIQREYHPQAIRQVTD